MKSLNRDLSVSLSQYATQQYQTPVLLIDCDAYDDLVSKKRNFVIVPIHSDLEIYKNMVIAPSAAKGEHTLAIDYGSVFVVLDVLRNYEDESKDWSPAIWSLLFSCFFYLMQQSLTVLSNSLKSLTNDWSQMAVCVSNANKRE